MESFPLDKVIARLILENLPVLVSHESVKISDTRLEIRLFCTIAGRKNLVFRFDLRKWKNPENALAASVMTELCDRCEMREVTKDRLIYCITHHNALGYNLKPDSVFSDEHKGYHLDACGYMLIWVDGTLSVLDNGESPQPYFSYDNVSKSNAFELFRSIASDYSAAFWK